MRYHWLAHHLVKEWFPKLSQEARGQIVSEAVCRAWCSFRSLDYRLMKSCICAAAQIKGLVPPRAVRSAALCHLNPAKPGSESHHRAAVIRLSDYR